MIKMLSKFLPTFLMMLLSLAFLAHYLLILIYKRVLIQEPNLMILSSEIFLMTAIFMYGVCWFIDQWIKAGKRMRQR